MYQTIKAEKCKWPVTIGKEAIELFSEKRFGKKDAWREVGLDFCLQNYAPMHEESVYVIFLFETREKAAKSALWFATWLAPAWGQRYPNKVMPMHLYI